MFAICHLSIVPIRKEANDRSEMVSQLLFGEAVEIIDKYKSWYKVKVYSDDYIGWVDQKQVMKVSEAEEKEYKLNSFQVSTDLLQIAFINGSEMCSLAIGSTLPFLQNKQMTFGGNNYVYEGQSTDSRIVKPANVVTQAQIFLNAPYLWGGRSPFGIDCSGFTQLVYKLCGYNLKRDANQQAEQGETITFLQEAKPGDLAFFENPDGRIVHVGILLHNNTIIHASGKVRIDKIDHQGIFNEENKNYSHNLRLIKRIV